MKRFVALLTFAAALWLPTTVTAVTEVGSLYCDPGAGIGGSNVNYFHAYLDGACVVEGREWYPGFIGGLESGIIGTSVAAGAVLVEGGGHMVTLPEMAFLARVRVFLPWGILGWEPTLRYGGELGFQMAFFRVTIGGYWQQGHSGPHPLLSFDVGWL